MERKDFLKKAACMCGLTMIPAAMIESCKKSNYAGPTNVNFTLDLTAAANTALNTTGGYLITNGLIIIRYDASTFDALSATCTHQGCTVGYNSSKNEILCPCHGGTYNPSTGAVISGPPPSGLSKYKVSLSGNILTVTS
jgi:cytochrome b6-f complex iron-sulfur subunit